MCVVEIPYLSPSRDLLGTCGLQRRRESDSGGEDYKTGNREVRTTLLGPYRGKRMGYCRCLSPGSRVTSRRDPLPRLTLPRQITRGPGTSTTLTVLDVDPDSITPVPPGPSVPSTYHSGVQRNRNKDTGAITGRRRKVSTKGPPRGRRGLTSRT